MKTTTTTATTTTTTARKTRRPATTGGLYSLLLLALSAFSLSSLAATKPTITKEPTGEVIMTAGSGQPAIFSIAATADPAPTYQWYCYPASGGGGSMSAVGSVTKKVTNTPGAAATTWTPVPNTPPYTGANTNTLTIANLPAGNTMLDHNGDTYYCAVKNSAGSANSTTAILTVKLPATPIFTTQPVNTATAANATLTFSATAIGEPTITYRWQSSNNTTTWSDMADAPGAITGAGTGKLTITHADAAMTYRCRATNPRGATYSNTAANLGPPRITQQPANTTITAGQNATLITAATGSPAPALQWQMSSNAGASWTPIVNNSSYTGATTPALTITSPPAVLNGMKYRCVATNTYGETPTNPVTLTINPATNTPPAITKHPADATINAGQSTTFDALATAAPAPSYKWQTLGYSASASWTDIADNATFTGAATRTLTIKNAYDALYGTKYRCVITNPAGTVTTNPATLTVNNKPEIYAQPAPATITAGQTATITVGASAHGNSLPAFQWYFSTNGGSAWTPVANTTPYTGAATPALTIANAPLTLNNVQYKCQITNTAGGVISNPVTLTVTPAPASAITTATQAAATLPGGATTKPALGATTAKPIATTTRITPPRITTQPANATIAIGATATYTIAATATPAPAYQWQARDTAAPAGWTDCADNTTHTGAKTTTLKVKAMPPPGVTTYRCIVTNTAGSATSNQVTCTVTPAPGGPNITKLVPSATAAEGATATFTASATGAPPLSYQWKTRKPSETTYANLANTPPYTGATTATLTITGCTPALNGRLYSCTITNNIGSTYTNTATLTVTPKKNTLPSTTPALKK